MESSRTDAPSASNGAKAGVVKSILPVALLNFPSRHGRTIRTQLKAAKRQLWRNLALGGIISQFLGTGKLQAIFGLARLNCELRVI